MTTPRLSNFQRFCVFVGFFCLALSIVALATATPTDGAAIAVVGVAWLFASRLTYRD